MKRFVLAGLVALLLSAGVGSARAQAPAGAGWRTIKGSQGYSFQVPPDWRTVPPAATARSVDVEVVAPQGGEGATAAVINAPAGTPTPLDINEVTQAVLQGIKQGSGIFSTSSIDVFDGPTPIAVANADAAEKLTAVYADSQGNPFVMSLRIVVQGESAYVFVVVAPEDAYSTDPNFGAILDSFQLSPT